MFVYMVFCISSIACCMMEIFLFYFWLHIHLVSNVNAFSFSHLEFPERTALFTASRKLPTVSHKGKQLPPCVTVFTNKT